MLCAAWCIFGTVLLYTFTLLLLYCVPSWCHYMPVMGGAGQTGAGHDIKPQEAMEMLGTCDGRLQALMAEANLLGDAASSQQQTPAEGVELRQAFASVLIESGETAF